MYPKTSKSLLTQANCTTETIAVFAAFFIRRFSTGANLDFSVDSLGCVDRILDRFAAEYPGPAAREELKVQAGCYILEVARMNFGGYYTWWDERNMPMLKCGGPDNRIALAPFCRVLGRIESREGDGIAVFFAHFVRTMARAKCEHGIELLHF